MTDQPDGGERGTGELIVAALAGSTLLPFINALATKAGEDVYRRLRSQLPRRGRRSAKAEIRETGSLTLTASDTRVVLRLPAQLTPEMVERLIDVRVPTDGEGWLLVSWHHELGRWVVQRAAQPPSANQVG